jgi:hypothetical protein
MAIAFSEFLVSHVVPGKEKRLELDGVIWVGFESER